MISKGYAEEHYFNTHTPVSCTLCGETIQREVLTVHKGENCPQRIETCEYCEFPLPAIDLVKHQEVCGNRTELCHLCNKYIRLREKNLHEISCNGVASSITEPSRNTRVSERARNGPRRRTNEFSWRSMLITIAITGTAVLLSSLFFQKKTESNQVH
ncbi:hypothetical protein Leryth_012342 [Lithospermum erythrorhizon]|nr:hypothetical protein Leryth_012342 [Lithospermum erythrorhizon]